MASRHLLFLYLLVVGLLGACAGTHTPQPPAGDPIDTVAAHTLFHQAVVLAHAGNLVRAEQYFGASIRRGADEGRVLPYLMDTCVAASRYRAAVEYATPYLQHHPGDWHLRFLVGSILAGIGEHQAARQQFETVLTLNANHAGAHYMLGTLLREGLNNPSAADGHLRRYLELEPHGEHAEEVRAALVRNVE